MSHWKNACGKRLSCGFEVVVFCTPALVAAALWLLASGPTFAQASNSDPLAILQAQRGGIGGLGNLNNGIVDTTSNLSPSQVLQPQILTPTLQPTSRLEQILSTRAGERLAQFGYDQLGIARQVLVPETGAIADDYIMGSGDEVVVSLRGQENSDVRTNVDRSGRVVLPRLTPIPAAGRSFGSFRQDVDAAVHRAYVASTASTTLGRVRQISVLVSGEVTMPGVRLVTGLSSVADAILLSGGVKKTGSLRNVQVRRGAQNYVVDLYSLLTGGGAGGAMRLADGDRVVIPPLGPTVAVSGMVRRPGIYELPSRARSITVGGLLSLAGGQEVRGRYRLSVQRIEPDGRLNLVSLQGVGGVIRDSEIMRVELGADLSMSQATLSGGTGLAGRYAVSSASKLSEILRAPGALGQTPYTLFGIVVRKDPRTLLRTLMAFTPVAVLNGTEDMQLQSDDVVRPIAVGESQMLAYVVKTYLDKLAYDQSRIRNPLDIQLGIAVPALPGATTTVTPGVTTVTPGVAGVAATGNVSANNPFGLPPGQLDGYSSGQDDFSSVTADAQRANIIALLDMAAPGSPLAMQRERFRQSSDMAAAPRTSTTAQAQQAAFATALPGYGIGPTATFGSADAAGNAMTLNAPAVLPPATNSLAPNYQDEPVPSGSFASNQEVQTFGELSRQLGIDPLILVNFLIDHRARLDGAVRGPGPYFIGPEVSLADLVQAAGGTVSWADESGVELLTTVVDVRNGRAATQRQTLPLRQGTLASYVVRPRDQLHFNKVFTDTGIGSVSVQGEVRFGGSYSITRGEHLSDLLMRVGGLNNTAYPAGTVFLRKSAAQVEEQGYKRAASEIQSQLLAGMARIGNDKISGEGFTAIQSFITQLRNQKGLGRIAIAADPSVLAANPQLDPLLEPGDVVFIPQRPSTITVLGEVMQPGSYTYQRGMKVKDYIKQAGGYAQYSDEDLTFLVLPDGSARKIETSWLNFDATALPPGSSIVVPRDLAPLTARQLLLDVTGIFSSFAVTAASLAVLAKQ